MQLFCFTYAGGVAAFFNTIEDCCKGYIEFVKLEYPGHGDRKKEPLCHSIEELAEDLYKEIKSKLSGNEYAFMGYSMGSIVLIEMLRIILERNDIPLPKLVFIAAHPPKVEIDFKQYREDEINMYVKKRTVLFGGIPESLIDNDIFWRVYLPLYKADYLMISKYNFKNQQFTTDIPAVIFYSESDTPMDEMKAWEKYFNFKCEFIEYSGAHFFINEHYEEMAKTIMEKLQVKEETACCVKHSEKTLFDNNTWEEK